MTYRIMVVEDEAIVAMDLRARLKNCGYAVPILVPSGEEAIARLDESPLDLVLMDIRLKGKLDGFETADLIHLRHNLPVIYLTAYADEATLERARSTGPYGYLLKPYDERQLRIAIEMALYQHQMEIKLRASEERFRRIFSKSPIGVVLLNSSGTLIDANRACLDIFGLKDILPLRSVPIFDLFCMPEESHARIDHGETVQLECRIDFDQLREQYSLATDKVGIIFLDSLLTSWTETGAAEAGYLIHLQDITDRKLADERIRHDARHDSLTDLPNRTYFLEQLKRVLERTQRHKEYLAAVLFLDLDRFKFVNDSLGHLSGDQMLIAVANRLRDCLRPGDFIARFGGDEFAILVDHINDLNEAIRVAERIQKEITQPVRLGRTELYTSGSIGIALTNPSYETPEELLRDADTAMYHAKSSGRARYVIFDSDMRSGTLHILELETDLRAGLERNEFIVHYQPIFSVGSAPGWHLTQTGSLRTTPPPGSLAGATAPAKRRTGSLAGAKDRASHAGTYIVGIEALLRWQHPTRGLVYPPDFLAVAEDTGLILQIGERMLRTACAQAKAWQDSLYPQLFVSVNISAQQTMDPGLVEMVRSVLAETGLAPSSLSLELKEIAIVKNIDLILKSVHDLKNMGVNISIDNFGQRHSTLDQIRRFPADTIKIDYSFLQGVPNNKSDAAVVTSLVAMAHLLGLSVIAEGVETQEQFDFLRSQCERVQGCLFSPAVPAEKISELLQGRH